MTVLSAPSAYLPPIGKIQHYATEDLTRSLCYLRRIYSPEVRGIRRVDRKRASKSPSNVTSGTPKHSLHHTEDDHNLEVLRSDAFERSYAIRWLTALVSKAYCLVDCADETNPAKVAAREVLIQEAASLLAVCAGAASAGTVTRVFRFPHGHVPIEVQLTDVAIETQGYPSVGAQTWGSACLLAETLVEIPHLFQLSKYGDGLRVIELGAGTGLVSLTLAKLLQARAAVSCSVVATDFHPTVLDNLRGNIEANFPVSQSVSVSACTLDWSRFPSAETDFPPLDEPFDLVLGADLIYEAEHARWIQGCVAKLLRKPSRRKGTSDTDPGLPPAQFHLVIPLRPTHVMECNEVEVVFPLIETLQQSADCPRAEPTLAVLSKEVITCETLGGVRTRNGAGDEVEYAHYIIGWCV